MLIIYSSSTLPYTTNHSFCFCRTYCSFTIETILAIAFGPNINVQGGEADDLTEAVQTLFEQSEEEKLVSKENYRSVIYF